VREAAASHRMKVSWNGDAERKMQQTTTVHEYMLDLTWKYLESLGHPSGTETFFISK
jgi:hypothetical protein